ncbi:hypothetical protein, partial [Escherichia coli]|uniref:hypothetical protein n=1 Tax=Escherichia coli TaxID=562 RepID=UPI0028DEE072
PWDCAQRTVVTTASCSMDSSATEMPASARKAERAPSAAITSGVCSWLPSSSTSQRPLAVVCSADTLTPSKRVRVGC